MTSTLDLMNASPVQSQFETTKLAECIESCFDCARTCLLCADACMAETAVKELIGCIRLDQDCADICDTTGRLLSRQYAIDPALMLAVLQTCVAATKLCQQECSSHGANFDHCELCAQACRRCEDACRALLGAMV